MADHALLLMQAIQRALDAELPLAGGWLATRIETPSWPVGYIDLTLSEPMRGPCFYAERHRGIVSVWSRKTVSNVPNPAEAFGYPSRLTGFSGLLSSRCPAVSCSNSNAGP